ncbi:MAG: response regulator [Pseudomonadota bacterium]|nr:MAG: response regulator [Pseudomonadota bacterium]
MTVPSTQRARKKRILVAEDDMAIATLLARVLGRDYDVVCAETGTQAVEIATRDPHFDLLLLDVMMPGMDGLRVASTLRALPQLKSAPIIFLTAKTSPQDIILGIKHGARHYIHKPFKIDDVVAKVKRAVGD